MSKKVNLSFNGSPCHESIISAMYIRNNDPQNKLKCSSTQYLFASLSCWSYLHLECAPKQMSQRCFYGFHRQQYISCKHPFYPACQAFLRGHYTQVETVKQHSQRLNRYSLTSLLTVQAQTHQ